MILPTHDSAFLSGSGCTPPGSDKIIGGKIMVAAGFAKASFLQKFFGLTGAFLMATAASAQEYSLDWFARDGGGGTSTVDAFVVRGAITEATGGPMTGGNCSISGEFLSLIAALPPGTPPGDAVATSFDNTYCRDIGRSGAPST